LRALVALAGWLAAAAVPAAPAIHPLVGTWVNADGSNADCLPRFEFRADGALVASDGSGAFTYEGALRPMDARGFYVWQGRFGVASGTPRCLGEVPAPGQPQTIYARLLHGGEHLGLCRSEAIESCALYLGRPARGGARPAVPADLGLAEPLGRAIERALAGSPAGVTLAAADAGPPVIAAGAKPPVGDCTQLAAWTLMAGAVLGEVSAARCPGTVGVAATADAGARETLAGGAVLTAFPTVLPGQDARVLWTAVVVDRARTSAVIVQASASQACGGALAAARPCRDPAGLARDVAKTLAADAAR